MTLPYNNINDIRKKGLEQINALNDLNKRYRMFNALSSKERNAFITSQAKKLAPYLGTAYEQKAAEALYNNQNFIKRFGIKAFNSLDDGTQNSYNIRKNLLQQDYQKQKGQNAVNKTALIHNTFKNVFGKDSNFQDLEAGLDDQGKLDLLKNKGYLTSNEIRNKLIQNGKEVQKEVDQKRKSLFSSLSFNNVGNANAFELYNQNKKADTIANYKDLEAKNKSIVENLYNQTQKRRENNTSGLATQMYDRLLQLNSSGKMSLKQSYDAFDKIATQYSPYYAQFKNSKWLKDYSNTDKLKDYAKFLALSQQYGDGVAITYLDRNMQNKVAKAQDWHITGNTLKGVATTMVSDLGSQIAMAKNVQNILDPKRMGIINQGLDPDKPIYADDNKTIIGYEKNNNIWTNPAYWNDMYMYNTFSPTEIELIKQRGGVSKDINVREYGWQPNEHFISWDTAYEGIKQGGHALAALLETGAGGVVGKTLGASAKFLGKGIMKGAGALNASGKVLNGLSKTGQVISKGAAKTHNFAMEVLAATNGPQGEAMGTFNEQLENNKEAVKDQIKKELRQYYDNIDFNSKEAQNAINGIYKELKAKDLNRLRAVSREGMKALPMSDKTLMQQAKQVYTNSLLKSEEERLNLKHAKDMQEAATNAAKTYMTNWAMDFAKETLVTHGVKKFLVAKGATMGDLDNISAKNFMADVKTGGVKRAIDNAGKEIKKVGAWNMAKASAKQIAGGFADEYFDGINANFSEAAGGNAFKQYINNQYDPNAYFDTMEGMYGNLIAGINGAINGVDDSENLYEGFIGAISPLVSATPNVGSVFTPKQTWNALRYGKDKNGKQISVAERMSYLINNPLLFEYSRLKEQDRAIDNGINAINKIVKHYKDNGGIDDAAKAMSATSDYSSAYNNVDANHPSSAVMTAEDTKLFNAFNLMSVVKTLENIEGGTKSALYEQTIDRLKGLAEGKLSDKAMEEEVTKFLSDPDNKSILDNNTPEQARVIAEGRLKKNATFFMDLYKKKDEIEAKLANSASLKGMDPRLITALEYQLLAKDNWKERLKTLEEETGVSYTNAEEDYNPNLEMIYGSHRSRERALRSRETDSQKMTKAQLEIDAANEKSQKTIESLQEQLINSKTKDEKDDIEEKIKQETNLIAARKLRYNKLKVQQEAIKQEVKILKDLIGNTKEKPLLESSADFSVDRILNSDARTRAEILNDANRGRYTKKQLSVIDKAKAKLSQQDPEALQKIQDAGELAHRVEDSNKIYDALLNNADIATVYFDAQSELRDRKALMESFQKEIDTHYKELDKVLEDKNSTDEDIRNTALLCSSTLLNAYMEDNPNSVSKLTPYYDLAKFDEDAASIIREREEPDDVKNNRFRALLMLQSIVQNKDELTQRIEEIIDDDDIPSEDKDFFNDLLTKMQTLGYQRNATVVEAREKKRKREAEEKAKREKEQAEKEAKAKAAQEQAKQEASKQSAKNSDEEPLVPEGDSTTEEPLVPNDETSDESSEEPLVPDGTPSSTTEKPDISSNGEGATEVKSEKVDLGEQSFVNSIMSDEAEDGDVDAGEIWSSTPNGLRKGVFVVNKNGNKLTFSINGDSGTLSISPNDYQAESSNEDKNKIFNATSIEKKDDGWYFNGNFAGKQETTQVKASDTFNLERAIDKQREASEKLYVKQGGDTFSPRIITNADGDTTVRSETIEEQTQELSEEEKNRQVAIITDNTPDVPTLNNVGERVNESPAVMSGNGMSEWMMGDKGENLLDEQGILKHKEGAEENDHMNQFYAWTEEQGWHIQNVIDRELGQILQVNPQAKFKFMSVTDNEVSDNTKDSRVFTDWFLVLDYDESINKGITSYHDESNGCVINCDGKRYLVVGTVYQKSGYNEATSRNLLFNTEKRNTGVKAEKARYFGENSAQAQDGYGVLFSERGEYIRQHPQERFYVSDKYTTEIVPNSLIPGYMVKRQEDDTEEKHRSLEELLNDKERNPFGYTLESIPIGIQMMSDFYITKPVANQVMYPRDPIGNMGAAFILFPSGNGRYFCAHVDPVMYKEMNEGSLKDRATQAINKLCSVNYDTRIEALKELGGIFHFDPTPNHAGNFILTNERSNTITFVRKGVKGRPIKLATYLDPKVIFDAFEEMNPRVNITRFNTSTKESLKELNDAGALNVNLAQLALAGSSYSVYGVKLDGTLDKPSMPTADIPTAPFNKNKRVVIYDNTEEGDVVQYVYNMDTGKYTLNGEPLNEEKQAALIKELDYNRRKIDGDMPFMFRMHSDSYYVADSTAPLVVRIDDNTHHAEELSEQDSQTLYDKYVKAKEDRERKEAAEALLEKVNPELLEEGAILTEDDMEKVFEESFVDYYAIDDDRNIYDALMAIFSDGPTTNNTQDKDHTEVKREQLTPEQYAIRKARLFDEGASSISFKELFVSNKTFKKNLISICKEKWEDFPRKPTKIEQYLRDKKIDIDNIPNSKEGIQALLDTIANCR